MQTFALSERFFHRRPLVIGGEMELRQYIATTDTIGEQSTVVLGHSVNGDGYVLKSLCTDRVAVGIECRDL